MEFKVQSKKREEIIDITEKVKELIKKSKEAEDASACLVYTPHATCGIIINENYDSAVCEDIIEALKKIFPAGVWKHDKIDNNADSHIKSSIVGPSQIIPMENGELMLGTWQGIGLAEFDGPRERKIIVRLLK